jgi:hypothetical protein
MKKESTLFLFAKVCENKEVNHLRGPPCMKELFSREKESE